VDVNIMNRTAETLMSVLLLGASCTAGPIEIVNDQTLLQGVVAHWAFDEISGTTVSDGSPAKHGGVLGGGTGGAVWVPGKFGSALHFEVGNEVTVQTFPAASAKYTVAMWVRPTPGDFGPGFVTLVSTEKANSGGWEMNMKLTPTEAYYQFGYYVGPGDGNYFTVNCTCVTPDVWTHIAGVVDWDNQTIHFYNNGIEQVANTIMRPMSGALEPIKAGSPTLYMGRWALPGRLFKGDLDDMVIYNKALTAAEIGLLFQNPAPNGSDASVPNGPATDGSAPDGSVNDGPANDGGARDGP
jgi:hypothetical protein